MRINQIIKCQNFNCADVKHECYTVPDIDINPEAISMILISDLQAGPSFFIEKSKRRMIADDISRAIALLK